MTIPGRIRIWSKLQLREAIEVDSMDARGRSEKSSMYPHHAFCFKWYLDGCLTRDGCSLTRVVRLNRDKLDDRCDQSFLLFHHLSNSHWIESMIIYLFSR